MSEFRSVNPATGEQIETFATTSDHDLERYLGRAVACNRSWRARSAQERAEVLHATAKTLRARSDDLARIATLEMGKPLMQAVAEVEKCAWACAK